MFNDRILCNNETNSVFANPVFNWVGVVQPFFLVRETKRIFEEGFITKKRYRPVDIITKLREADIHMSQKKTFSEKND